MSEHLFNKIVRMEEKRAMRSQRPLILLILDAEAVQDQEDRRTALAELAAVLPGTLRHTDVTGWYEPDASLGILLTEIGTTKPTVARQKVATKIADALKQCDFPWGDAISVTAQVTGNGAGPAVETIKLGRVLGLQETDSGHLEKPHTAAARPAHIKELLLVGCDACLVALCSLFPFGRSPLAESPGDVRFLIHCGLLLLILLSVSLVFGFYRMEQLWLSKNKLRRIGFATLSVLGMAMLWVLVAPKLFIRPELFLGQALLAWALSLAWKLVYLKHHLKSEVDRVLSIQHHKAL